MSFKLEFIKNIIGSLALGGVLLLSSATVYADTAENSKTQAYAYITNTNVNFRADASMDAPIYTTLSRGTNLTVQAFVEDGWSQVIYNDQEGYVKTEYISEKSEGLSADESSSAELLDWSEAKNIFTTYTAAKIYDVRTGITYYVQSFSNGKHADVETLTQEDTNLLLQTYGGSWQWDPRPIFVSINGRTMAASINGMPHGSGTISDNGLNGQVCIHFRGSTTHNGNTTFAQDHQDAVIEAWNAR